MEPSLSLHAAILERVPDAVVAVDADHRVIYWNAAAAAFYRVPAGEILGRPVTESHTHEWITPGDRQQARAALERDGRWRGDSVHVLRSGEHRHVEVSISRLAGQGGSAVGFVAVIRDVTERRELERRLEEARDRFGFALRAAHAASWDWDMERGVVEWTPELHDLFGFGPDVTPSHEAWLAAIHPEDRERLRAEFASEAAAHRREYRIEHRIVRHGEVRWIANVGVIAYGASGAPRGATGISIDITAAKMHEIERERLLEAERAARSAADAALRARDLFMATVSHELRNPVNAVLGWAQILAASVTTGDDRVARAVAAIERGARAEAKLIDELIDVSRATTGKLRIEKRRIDLSDAVRRATDQIRPAAAARRLTVVDEVESGIEIDADESRIQQIAGNLLSNALKFTPSRGRIEVRLRRDSRTAVLTVADTGEGIAPDFLASVFEPFAQAVESARRHAGLGLGLAITRRLVELHGGTITAHSEGRGRGTTMTVRLPLAAAPDRRR